MRRPPRLLKALSLWSITTARSVSEGSSIGVVAGPVGSVRLPPLTGVAGGSESPDLLDSAQQARVSQAQAPHSSAAGAVSIGDQANAGATATNRQIKMKKNRFKAFGATAPRYQTYPTLQPLNSRLQIAETDRQGLFRESHSLLAMRFT